MSNFDVDSDLDSVRGILQWGITSSPAVGVWVLLEAVTIEKKVEQGAIGLTFNSS